MGRRRRREEEHDNHERWLVSYADFITLLFAFFVVMYSLSSVNEGKYRVLSDSLVQAFRNVTVNDSGEQIELPRVSVLPTRPITQAAPPATDRVADQRRRETAQRMRNMADEIVAFQRHQRNAQLPGLAQCTDDELFGVAGMRSVGERRPGDAGDGVHVAGRFIADDRVHGAVR